MTTSDGQTRLPLAEEEPHPVEPPVHHPQADDHAEDRHAPLAVRMRPRGAESVRGQSHLLHAGSPLQRLIEGGSGLAGPMSVVLWGPPGTGKTTLARLIAAPQGRRFTEVAAVSAGVKDLRAIIEGAKRDLSFHGRHTVLFVDEIHRFSKSQQDVLLPAVENRWVILVAATTENPSFSVISPLLSRSLVVTLEPLGDDDVHHVLNDALAAPHGLNSSVAAQPGALDSIVRLSNGDARRALTILEATAGVALSRNQTPATITPDDVHTAMPEALMRYDATGDQHYDVASALIKSIRGSDADAALHYLARMLSGGEDPRFICRRLIISASEDIGLADPHALTMAVSALTAVSTIGMPEARIVLGELAIYLALAPKSNAAYRAIDAALADVRAGRVGTVPAHLRGTGYAGAQALGHGAGYRYPHDHPWGVEQQNYLPDALSNARYYHPTERGEERALGARWEHLRAIVRGEPAPSGIHKNVEDTTGDG